MDAAEYKNVVLGLIFLKCVSDTWHLQGASRQAKKRALRRSRG